MNKIYTLFLLLIGLVSHAQENAKTGLSFYKSFYIHGESLVVGNQITASEDSELNNSKRAVNDETSIALIDIDDDPNTFSSSSVNIKIPNEANIHHATLYWTGTYPGEHGKKKLKKKRYYYKIDEDRKHPIDEVKLSVNHEKYIDIKGKIVHGQLPDTPDETTIYEPYVSKADITELLQKHKDSLHLTVANVPAAQGYIAGGSTAGWVIFIVVENPNKSKKYINLYDGYQSVFNSKDSLKITNFKSENHKNAQTKIKLVALDGDRSLKNDQVVLKNIDNERKLFLENETRHLRNLFNSTIDNSNYVTKRNPDYQNTLGFDIAQFNVNSSTIVPDGTQALNIRFQSRNDRYALILNTFETEIDPHYNPPISSVNSDGIDQELSQVTLKDSSKDKVKQASNTLTTPSLSTEVTTAGFESPDNKTRIDTTSKTQVSQSNNDNENTKRLTDNSILVNNQITKNQNKIENNNTASLTQNTTQLSVTNHEPTDDNEHVKSKLEQATNNNTAQNETIVSQPKQDLSNLTTNQTTKSSYKHTDTKINDTTNIKKISPIEPGFYLVTNAFSDPENTAKWLAKLVEKGYQPQSFLWPNNGLTYIYIAYDKNSFMLRDILISARQNPLLKEAWIKEIK